MASTVLPWRPINTPALENPGLIDDMVKVLSWYDNESGYSHRMVDLAAMVGAQL